MENGMAELLLAVNRRQSARSSFIIMVSWMQTHFCFLPLVVLDLGSMVVGCTVGCVFSVSSENVTILLQSVWFISIEKRNYQKKLHETVCHGVSEYNMAISNSIGRRIFLTKKCIFCQCPVKNSRRSQKANRFRFVDQLKLHNTLIAAQTRERERKNGSNSIDDVFNIRKEWSKLYALMETKWSVGGRTIWQMLTKIVILLTFYVLFQFCVQTVSRGL